MAADNRPSVDLIESAHTFPGTYRIKAIGNVEGDFAGRLVEAVRSELTAPSDLEHVIRSTPGGRHVALTLDIHVQSAEQVRTLYARIQEVEGLVLVL